MVVVCFSSWAGGPALERLVAMLGEFVLEGEYQDDAIFIVSNGSIEFLDRKAVKNPSRFHSRSSIAPEGLGGYSPPYW